MTRKGETSINLQTVQWHHVQEKIDTVLSNRVKELVTVQPHYKICDTEQREFFLYLWLFDSLVRGVQKTSRTIYVVAVALSCSAELGGKTLLSKISHISDTEFWGIEMELTLASLLKIFSHNIWTCIDKLPRKKHSTVLQALMPTNNNNNQHEKIVSIVTLLFWG